MVAGTLILPLQTKLPGNEAIYTVAYITCTSRYVVGLQCHGTTEEIACSCVAAYMNQCCFKVIIYLTYPQSQVDRINSLVWLYKLA